VAKYPEYKTKYKSLGLKDKVVAKYYSTGGAKVNKLVKDVAENTPLPGVGLIAKSVPKATRVVKELANKFTQSKRTLPEAMPGREKLKPAEPLGRPFKDKKEKELYGRFQQRMKKHGFFKDE